MFVRPMRFRMFSMVSFSNRASDEQTYKHKELNAHGCSSRVSRDKKDSFLNRKSHCSRRLWRNQRRYGMSESGGQEIRTKVETRMYRRMNGESREEPKV